MYFPVGTSGPKIFRTIKSPDTQLMGSVIPYFQRLQKEGEAGRKKITQITRYGTVMLATMQSYGVVAVFLPSLTANGQSVVMNPGFMFTFTGIISMVTGTLFLMWLAQMNY